LYVSPRIAAQFNKLGDFRNDFCAGHEVHVNPTHH